jgi:uncharacterized delta-60 repeat protein
MIFMAAAAGSAEAIEPVPTTAPIEAEGGHIVADGPSQVLTTYRFSSEEKAGLTRVNLDGSLDPSFGEGGSVQADEVDDVAVDADGKILVARSGDSTDGKVRTEARITRLLPDGQPDPTFGVGGNADIRFGPRWDYAEAVATEPDGDILVAGVMIEYSDDYGFEARLVVARLKPDGSLDPSFGRRGVARLPFRGEIEAPFVASLPSGGIVVEGGNEIESFFIWKLKPDGAVDSHFAYGGVQELRSRPTPRGRHEELFLLPGAQVLPSGKLLFVAAGERYRHHTSEYPLVAVRLRADGGIDRSYGKDGWSIVEGASPTGSTLLPNGDLAVATNFEGKSAKGHPFGVTVLRPDGRLDKRYGRGGYCRASLAGRPSAAGIAVVGGRVIVGGEGARGSWLLDCPPAP